MTDPDRSPATIIVRLATLVSFLVSAALAVAMVLK